MIHTQYYALMRAISQSLQAASKDIQINQWDYNFNTKTFDSIKLHRNPLPYPKGIINITNVKKDFIYPLPQNMTVGMNAADLVQFPNAFPVASVVDKFEVYALTNRYEITFDVTLLFETGAQLIDFYHKYSEYYPHNSKYFYDFKYYYYLHLPPEIIEDFDPTKDESINIYGALKDDASSLEYFSKCVSTPILKADSITMNQDKSGDNHTLNISFSVSDSFVYILLKVDARYWLRALSTVIEIKADDYNGDEDISPDQQTTIPTGIEDPYPDFKADNQDTTEIDTNNDTVIEGVT